MLIDCEVSKQCLALATTQRQLQHRPLARAGDADDQRILATALRQQAMRQQCTHLPRPPPQDIT
jgi:hypothetical protein